MPTATKAVESFTTSLNKFVNYVAEKTGTRLTPITTGAAGAASAPTNVRSELPSAAGGAMKQGTAIEPTTGTSDLNTYLKKVALVESGGKANAKASTSSASGLFQFTEGTWKQTTKEMGKNYSLEDRFDPQKSAEVAAYFTQRQRTQLEKGTGKTASDADLYMAHFLGAGGATKFLNALNKNPDAPASAGASSDQIKANASIFMDASGRERTLQEVYNLMGGKMDRAGATVSQGKATQDVNNINVQSAKIGGVLTGPMSGYPAVLHGVEAVVPLPDGKTIPVELNDRTNATQSDSFTQALSDFKQDLSRLFGNTNNGVSPELVSLMAQLVDLQRTNNSTAQRMLQASQG